MTPWASLGADTIEDLVVYIRSWQHEKTVPKDVDWTTRFEGDSVAGQQMFKMYCVHCHGQRGEGYLGGGPGTGIGLPGFLNVASDGYILQTLKTGRVGTAMRSFYGARDGLANLSDDELKNLYSELVVKFERFIALSMDIDAIDVELEEQIKRVINGLIDDKKEQNRIYAIVTNPCELVYPKNKNLLINGLALSFKEDGRFDSEIIKRLITYCCKYVTIFWNRRVIIIYINYFPKTRTCVKLS